jgi:hypothetical protein
MIDPTPERDRSRESIVPEIKRIHGQDIFPSYRYMEREAPELLEAALRIFGPWENALAAAGVICPRSDWDIYFDHELGAWVHDSLTQPISRHFMGCEADGNEWRSRFEAP